MSDETASSGAADDATGTAPPGPPAQGAEAVQTADADAEQEPGNDAGADSPAAWTALAAPGKPDGEVDTRAR